MLAHEFMQLHVQANLGIYFDEVTYIADGVWAARSDTITDQYWNFAYRDDGEAASADDLAAIRSWGASVRRSPTVWQAVSTPVPEGYKVVAAETWMTIDGAGLKMPESCVVPPGLSYGLLDKPSPDMAATFTDAYCSGPGTDAAGYFALPPEYEQAYRQGAVRPPIKALNVRLAAGEHCVAIATICAVGSYAGLYSVAVPHAHRRRGYGSLVSTIAIGEAFSRGADHVFLQTEAGSVAEGMYASIGFRREFVGTLLG